MKLLFEGSMTALITPFDNGKVDEKALRHLIDWQIAEGTSCLVPCGTTGEAPTLSYEEHERVVSVTVEQVSGRVPVLAGCGSNATENAIKLTKQAKKAGAQGTLQVTPYYNKPTQEGLFQHFEAIAKAVDLPMVLYNVPVRTAVNLEATTVIRLSKIATIVGVKEASGKLEQIDQIIKETPDHFSVVSGDDALNTQIYMLGGNGTISVTANIVPKRVAKVWKDFLNNNRKEALIEHESLQTLNKILFIETNPIPVKTALAMMNKCKEEFRLPLCPMEQKNKIKLKEVLKKEELI
ncbi:MAG: 4-hydroxy-tetrahydrodipicolinate synthase [Deltaproteobacteria bacterium RIFCSPLOWO2_01_44_7]|nr:MAG: 4-hydroxy-tetrahydrodipicolinate synthase [Deltaproteobacteria bacterium RIFCSPHIGHO2_01_FULL_43_49]OGQ14514.1 MAG: 4-hydroxy-tetrahydrodipicolinate synthase [Deltaproteobacteria bacterium RIFCSPHIGHO2_02_FULL_44_53]OGQ27900.1 MAG: 4-hydroxy-tetrahydrodipicolinate synthase [Deltaproteobacteria bacterium RIFCSPHIGHO2_12_FULL_44_21]OGQ31112.1 MAG: 4-hydroxy-tetrahydrodipicolinate synthase [Deltaproteobacteria bacterium RIFCSPLOWO2_01_FULL_45_74]OGQ38206.1 MAG: 4-hydroxy-tetrahydrodipicoli